MSKKEELESALKEAMRSKNEVVRTTIRMALSNIKLAEIEKGSALDDTLIISLLQKEIKVRNEAIADAQKANRPDLVAANLAELKVLEGFLPGQLTEADLMGLVQAAITETGAAGPADMGKVMKNVMPKIQGRAANDAVSSTVKMLLSKLG